MTARTSGAAIAKAKLPVRKMQAQRSRLAGGASAGAAVKHPAQPKRVAAETGVDPSAAQRLGPRALAILQAKTIAAADLVAAGGAYTLDEVMTVLNDISRQRVEQLVRSGRLLAVPGDNNRRCYPAIQFADDGTLTRGLDLVQDALPTKNAWAVLNFLVNPDDRLYGRRPIDVLATGDTASVVRAARSYGEPGA